MNKKELPQKRWSIKETRSLETNRPLRRGSNSKSRTFFKVAPSVRPKVQRNNKK